MEREDFVRTPRADWFTMAVAALGCMAMAFGLALISLSFPQAGIFATLWLPTAAIVGIMLSIRRSDFGAALAGSLIGLFGGEYVSEVPLASALALTAANGAEIAIAVLLTRRWCGPRFDFTDAQGFFRFVGAMLLAALASTLIATAATGAIVADPSSGPLFLARHGSSLLFLSPLVMVAMAAWRQRGQGGNLVPMPVVAVVLAGTCLILWQTSFPFLFLATPFVVLAGICSGIGGTAFILVAIAGIASFATAMGHGPIVLTRGGMTLELVSLQLFLASLTVVGIPLAGLIEQGNRDREALRASRDEKRRVLDGIGEVIFSIDWEGRWQTLNLAWERISGRGREECIGRPFDHFLSIRERDRLAEEIERLRVGTIPMVESELSFDRPDGEVRHVEIRMRLAHSASGQPQGMVGQMIDVTDRASNRRALEASERQFATLAELAPAGLYRTDAQGRCTWVNRAWIESTGMKDGAWQGAGWADAIHPDDFDRVHYEWTAAAAAGGTFGGEWRWLRPDGQVVFARSAAAPQRDENGEIVGFIGINMDVTESRAAEAEIAARDRRLKTITDTVRDALFMIAPDGTCRYASPFAGTMFGVSPDRLVGHAFAELFGAEAGEAIGQRLRALWQGEESACDLQFRTGAEGDRGIWVDAHFATVAGAEGVDAVVASVRDISDARRLEHDLTHARRRAEHAAQAKAGFLANMSHEIRTPMNGVLGFTELLLESDLDAGQRRHAQLIADSGRAMMRLLNDILDMSKIDAGKLVISPAPVDLRAKIATCVGLMQPAAGRAGLLLETQVDDAVPDLVMGDPLRLRQILLNLVGNAVKFTVEGSVTVEAKVESGPDGADWLAVAVIDTGIGIPEDRLAAIFEQFQQADGSVGRRYGGTGLGLVISSQLAQLMGGSIDVASTVGLGTVFTLRIPLVAAGAEGQAIGTAPDALLHLVEGPAQRAALPQMGAAPRVLVAEDNDINQELVLAMARRAGVAPDLAHDGAEAIRLVEEADRDGNPYRLVLMDMMMPEMDGLEATRRLRTAGFAADRLPIVALTANCFADDIAACRSAGMQGHLAKPLRMDALARTIQRHLAPAAMAARFPAPASAPDAPSAVAASPVTATRTDAGEDGLAARYRARKEKLLRELADVAEGKGTPEWDALAMQLHKLAGTAGYFGDSRLGELARTLEDRLRHAGDGADRIELVQAEWQSLRAVA